jgi:diguanylate cyclase (GGDEF)-like protein
MRDVSEQTGVATATMGRVAGWLFLIGSAMTIVGIGLPHARQADIRGFWVMAAGTALAGSLILHNSHRISRRGYEACMLVASLTITLSLYLNGERHGAPSAGNQVLYVWVALYSGHFFSRAATAVQLSAITVFYAVVLFLDHSGSVALTRWVITVGMVTAAAVIVQYLKLHNDELLERLAAAARTDSLTGLANRQGFDEAIERELARARRTGRPTTLIIADIDHFKDINDRVGHAAGDAALRVVGATARKIARTTDTAARIGGDEFAIILPDTDAEGAFLFAERMRKGVMNPSPHQHDSLTMSLGIAESDVDGRAPDPLIRAADRALYQAKELGRNQTVAASGARERTRDRTTRVRLASAPSQVGRGRQ